MKITALVLLGTLATVINSASAEEVSADEASNSNEYYKKYCTELAEQSGIENDEEFKQYVKDCLESYIGPGSE